MAPKRALITGITGMDGSYLAELLLIKGYEVHGIVRRSSSFNTRRIDHIFDRLHLHFGDMCDASRVATIINDVRPNEIYNLGAQSHVRVSFDMPAYTLESVLLGTVNVLEAARGAPARVYQASSSEMFGDTAPPQHEGSAFRPRSPYAVAKAAAHQMARNYREGYGLFVACGILFNHESPRRGHTFVTQKIAEAARARRPVVLGNLAARRDWGYAPEYVEGMWRMLQQDEPRDYVLATGKAHAVQEFAEAAYRHVGLDAAEYVTTDDRYLRPTEVDYLCGDASRARKELGWTPRVGFDELVAIMVTGGDGA